MLQHLDKQKSLLKDGGGGNDCWYSSFTLTLNSDIKPSKMALVNCLEVQKEVCVHASTSAHSY